MNGLALAPLHPNVNYRAQKKRKEKMRVSAFHNGPSPFSKNKRLVEPGISITGIKPEPPFLERSAHNISAARAVICTPSTQKHTIFPQCNGTVRMCKQAGNPVERNESRMHTFVTNLNVFKWLGICVWEYTFVTIP